MDRTHATRAYLLHVGFALFVLAFVLTAPPPPPEEESGDMEGLVLLMIFYCAGFILFPTAAGYCSLRLKPRDNRLWFLTLLMLGLVALAIYDMVGISAAPPATRASWVRVARWVYLIATFSLASIHFVSRSHARAACLK